MARVVLADTGFSSAPLVAHLTGAGHALTVVGGRPDDALVRAGLDHVDCDYSDPDRLAVAVPDGALLVPGCNDVSLLACAQVGTERGLPGHDPPAVVGRLLDKLAFRDLCEQHGVAAPRLVATDDTIGRDVVVKPTRGYSGHGISMLQPATAAASAAAVARARAASLDGGHLVEELAAGQLMSHSAFVVEGRTVAEFWVREHGTATPVAVDVSAVVAPPVVAPAVRADVHRLVETLALTDGLVHTQVLVERDRHHVVEVTRRCPGDLYAELVRRATGYDYAAAYCAAFVGERPPSYVPGEIRPVLRTTISPVVPTVLGAVALPVGLPPGALVPLGRAGDRLGRGPEGRVGVLFLDCTDADELATWWDRAVTNRLHVPVSTTNGS